MYLESLSTLKFTATDCNILHYSNGCYNCSSTFHGSFHLVQYVLVYLLILFLYLYLLRNIIELRPRESLENWRCLSPIIKQVVQSKNKKTWTQIVSHSKCQIWLPLKASCVMWLPFHDIETPWYRTVSYIKLFVLF